MTSERIEVAVSLKYIEAGANSYRCDQAVGERPYRFAGSSASSVQGGCMLEVGEPLGRDELASRQQAAQLAGVRLIAATGEHLHHDDIRGVQRGVAFDQPMKLAMSTGTRGPEIVDPS